MTCKGIDSALNANGIPSPEILRAFRFFRAILATVANPDKKKSRQAQLIERRKKAGLCRRCAAPVAIKKDGEPATYCPSCQEMDRVAARTRYRRNNGIPLSAPPNKYRKKRGTKGK